MLTPNSRHSGLLRESHQIIGARDKAKPPISKAQVVSDQCRAIISWKRVKSWAVRRKPVQCCDSVQGYYSSTCHSARRMQEQCEACGCQILGNSCHPDGHTLRFGLKFQIAFLLLVHRGSRTQFPCAAVLCAAVLTVAGVRTSQVLQDEVRSVEQLGPWDRTIVDSARKAQGDRRASPHFGEGLEHRVQVALSPQCRRTPGLCN